MLNLDPNDLLYRFRTVETALADAIKYEQELVLHQCSFAIVAQKYREARALGSAEAAVWLEKEGGYLPVEIDLKKSKWAEIPHSAVDGHTS